MVYGIWYMVYGNIYGIWYMVIYGFVRLGILMGIILLVILAPLRLKKALLGFVGF